MFGSGMNFGLGEEIDALRDMVQRWAADKLAPRAAEIDETNEAPKDLWPQMGELGLLGITADPEYGGTGMGYLAHVVATEEISRASASVGLSYGAHSNLCVNQINRWGNAEQKAMYLPKLCSGEHFGALAMSESGSGSDVVSMKLRADKRNDRFILNGNKMWITNGPDAETLVVYAKTDPDAGVKGITAFLIEKSMTGFSTAQKLNKLGMRGSNTCELVFEDCEVPFENVLGEEGQGFSALSATLDIGNAYLAAEMLGIAQESFDRTLQYLKERKQFGVLIGSFQALQHRAAHWWSEVELCKSVVLKVLQSLDQGDPRSPAMASIAKAKLCEVVELATNEAIQMHGGIGMTDEYEIGFFIKRARPAASLYGDYNYHGDRFALLSGY